jgi:hypothetical protein
MAARSRSRGGDSAAAWSGSSSLKPRSGALVDTRRSGTGGCRGFTEDLRRGQRAAALSAVPNISYGIVAAATKMILLV